MRLRTSVAAAAIAWPLVTAFAYAHHGMTNYDFERKITLKGTVTQFDFTNPHVLLHVDVRDGGKSVTWIAETGSPNMMRRGGWTKSSLKAGDQVTVIGHPAKDGSPSLRFIQVVLPNGQTLDPASGFR